MDYIEQKKFLMGSRLWGGAWVSALLLAGLFCLRTSLETRMDRAAIAASFIVIALAVFMYYTPDYLHLTANPDKRPRWAINIRWRIITALLIGGLGFSTSVLARETVVLSVLCLIVLTVMAKKLPLHYVSICLSAGELIVISALLLYTPLNLLAGTALLAFACHLAIVVSSNATRWGVIAGFIGLLIILLSAENRHISAASISSFVFLLLISILATVVLVSRTQQRNQKNIAVSMQELMHFTGYAADKIQYLWSTSNEQLARNWQAANLSGATPDALAEWYRQNSELYLFALSGYNLEYKRIRSNLNVLALGRGACLDYGAGNGEILLELAKRGHAVSYYDVEGITKKFAQARAEQRKVSIQFFSSKEQLAASARQHGFDTIYSLDVLEHLPDLEGEFNFLASLLNPSGLFVFDVPAGATKSHPMHLDHQLDVVEHMRRLGLKDERQIWQRLPFRKEEKYFFRAPVKSSKFQDQSPPLVQV